MSINMNQTYKLQTMFGYNMAKKGLISTSMHRRKRTKAWNVWAEYVKERLKLAHSTATAIDIGRMTEEALKNEYDRFFKSRLKEYLPSILTDANREILQRGDEDEMAERFYFPKRVEQYYDAWDEWDRHSRPSAPPGILDLTERLVKTATNRLEAEKNPNNNRQINGILNNLIEEVRANDPQQSTMLNQRISTSGRDDVEPNAHVSNNIKGLHRQLANKEAAISQLSGVSQEAMQFQTLLGERNAELQSARQNSAQKNERLQRLEEESANRKKKLEEVDGLLQGDSLQAKLLEANGQRKSLEQHICDKNAELEKMRQMTKEIGDGRTQRYQAQLWKTLARGAARQQELTRVERARNEYKVQVEQREANILGLRGDLAALRSSGGTAHRTPPSRTYPNRPSSSRPARTPHPSGPSSSRPSAPACLYLPIVQSRKRAAR
jgi:hypothetical protein